LCTGPTGSWIAVIWDYFPSGKITEGTETIEARCSVSASEANILRLRGTKEQNRGRGGATAPPPENHPAGGRSILCKIEARCTGTVSEANPRQPRSQKRRQKGRALRVCRRSDDEGTEAGTPKESLPKFKSRGKSRRPEGVKI